MAKKLTKKQRQANVEKASEWQKQKKVMHVKSGEDLEVIISTDFRTYIEETLNYLFSLHEENEIITSLEHIKTKFVNIPEDAPANPFMNAVWTLMSISTAINKTAVEQGAIIFTDEAYDENLKKFIKAMEKMDDDGVEGLKDSILKQKEDFEKLRSADLQRAQAISEKLKTAKTDDNKESSFDGEKAGKTSTED
jgi:hypothetical protein